MTAPRTLAALLAVLILAGCEEVGPAESCRIVSVDRNYTCVEFPDGTRRRRYGVWGQVGDSMMAATLEMPGTADGWTTPTAEPEPVSASTIASRNAWRRGWGVGLGSLVLFAGGWFAGRAKR